MNEVCAYSLGKSSIFLPKQVIPENRDSQLRLFDQATERHRRRPSARRATPPRERGWRREDLYERGRSR